MITFSFIPPEERQRILPFLEELNRQIPRATLDERLAAMFASGYQCIGIADEDELIGISGLWVLVKYYVGKHVEMDNVVIAPAYRGRGIGRLLVQWVDDYARSIGCDAAELNCYIGNADGQAFWERSGYRKIGYHYQKSYR